jgi:DNA polymerase III delta prime subunit
VERARRTPSGRRKAATADPWRSARDIDAYLRDGGRAPRFLVPRLLAPGCVTLLNGPRGCGKTELARFLAVELARRGKRVLYVDRDNPPWRVRLSFARWLRPREKLGDRLKVLDRNAAPHLLKKSAWQSLPAEAFDVLVVDSLDASAEGVGERDSAKPSRAMASLLDLARREKGPAVLLLNNVVKTGKYGRGSGIIEDRADIVYEVRDVTDFKPTGRKPWFQELPDAGRAAWAERAARRAGQDRLRLALVATKFRVGEEPEPWAVELNFSTRPYTCREITIELEAAAQRALHETRRAQREAEDRAAALLAEEVRRRAEEGRPLLYKRRDAEPFLCRLGLTRRQARAILNHHAGQCWVLRPGPKGQVLLPPSNAYHEASGHEELALEFRQDAPSSVSDVAARTGSRGHDLAFYDSGRTRVPDTRNVAAPQEADGHVRNAGSRLGPGLQTRKDVAAPPKPRNETAAGQQKPDDWDHQPGPRPGPATRPRSPTAPVPAGRRP